MKNIDAPLLKKMFISASNNLYNHYPEIDALNVFPVPDGDTGMNMNLTLASGAKEIQNREDQDVYALAKSFSRGLLMGARGNSGVITSQIFRGFAEGLKDQKIIDKNALINAFITSKEYAYKAVIKPVEGTILTVCRESCEYVADKIDQINSIEDAFDLLLKEAKKSLKHTPDLLPVLKEVGVVDSGGTGLLTIYEGMYAALKGNPIEKKQYAQAGQASKTNEVGYCTEIALDISQTNENKKTFNENKFINTLKMHGTNLVYYKDENLIKIHLHTFTPGWLLNYTQQFGEFQQVKIENMAQSHHEYTLFADLKEKLNLNSETKESQIFSSNTKDEAKEAPLKEYGMIATCSGDGVAAMFKEIGVDIIVSGGQTMNPSTEDFVSAIRKVRAKHVFIFPNNSNIVMAATQACDVCKKEVKAKVIASTTVPQGLVASMMLNPDADYSENAREMKKALKNVKSASITYATKDTQIGNIKVIKDQFIALIDKKIICCVEDKYDALYRTLDKLINDSSSIVTVFTGEDISEEETEKLSEELNTKYDMIEVDVKKGNQPVYSFIIGVE